MRKSKPTGKKARPQSARASRRVARRPRSRLRSTLRVHVRAPRVHVMTPAPVVSAPTVQVEAPAVNIQAPKPIVIPAPIVQVEVEAWERTDEAGLKSLRKELNRCLREQQTIELLLAGDGGLASRRYRIGRPVRVEEGIVELRGHADVNQEAARILIPLHQIVALIPTVRLSEEELASDEREEQETIALHWDEDAEQSHNG